MQLISWTYEDYLCTCPALPMDQEDFAWCVRKLAKARNRRKPRHAARYEYLLRLDLAPTATISEEGNHV